MGRRRFLEEARDAAEGVLFPLLYDRQAIPGPFADAFEKRFHHEPDFTAAAAYDSVQLTVAAVRKAGLNRARIGDALRAISPWKGVSGTIQWDPLGSNIRPVPLGTIQSGRRQQSGKVCTPPSCHRGHRGHREMRWIPSTSRGQPKLR